MSAGAQKQVGSQNSEWTFSSDGSYVLREVRRKEQRLGKGTRELKREEEVTVAQGNAVRTSCLGVVKLGCWDD